MATTNGAFHCSAVLLGTALLPSEGGRTAYLFPSIFFANPCLDSPDA